MRHQPLSPTFHSANRARLAEAVGPEAVAIIDTADVLTRAGDYEYPFRPDSNFYYLTGIAEPEAILMLLPGHPNPAMRELLFVSGTSEFVGQWEGDRHTKDEAAKLSGIKTVLDLTDFDFYAGRLLGQYGSVYTNADTELGQKMTSPALRRVKQIREDLPTAQLRSALPLIAKQRMIKSPDELKQLREAIRITGDGLAAAFATVQPGQREYEIEAALTGEFIRAGSTNAFTPIVAAGRSSTIIHHMRNDGPVEAGDLVLMDVGAEYGYYAADISRTFPAGGTFTPRQRAVYDAVLRLQKFAYGLLKPGITYQDYEKQVGEAYLQELVELKVIKPSEATGDDAMKVLRKHYPHRTSHFLGLDLHDAGDYTQKIQPGMVFTVEPGIYLREESIGVRLEDVILITETGYELLSSDIPSDPDEIEKIIQAHQS